MKQNRLRIGFIALILLLVFGASFSLWTSCKRARQLAAIAHCRTEMAALQLALQAYGKEYHASPTGDNVVVMAALRGANAKMIVFMEVSPHSLGPRGEFLDPWRVPYRIDVRTNATVQVISAGPNGRFDDQDDVAAEP